MSAPDVDPARNNQLPRATRRWRWILFGAWFVSVAVIIGCADDGMFRPFFKWIDAHPGSDKVGHFGLIGGLAFMLNVALGMRRVALGPIRLALGGLLVGVVITLEEFSQLWIPSRKFDWGDLAANYAGILCAGWLAAWWLRKRKP